MLYKSILNVVAVVVAVTAVLLVGCGGDDNPGDGGGGGSLVCANGEAWVDDDGGEGALIFRSNGEVLFVEKDGNTWYVVEDESGTYSTSGNTLTTYIGGGTFTMTYSVSNNKLTLTIGGESSVYTKRSGISPVYHTPGGGVGASVAKGTFTDSRNGKSYKTVKIGTQTWFAENLNYVVGNSACYEGNSSNCATYGRLYDWETALTACPAGWHLPSDAEWTTLTDYVGGVSTAGGKLKSTSGWYNNGNGTDDFGFSALPGGSGYGNDYFLYVGSYGYWWSATEVNANTARNRYMLFLNEYVYWDNYDNFKTYLLSVRCVEN